MGVALLLLPKRSMWTMFQNAMLSVLIKFPYTVSTSVPRRFRSEMIMRKHLAHKPINGNQSVREIAHQTCSMYSCSLYVRSDLNSVFVCVCVCVCVCVLFEIFDLILL